MPISFAYQPLRGTEIRLLSIELSEFNQPLKLFLEHVPLDTAPEYMALSYVWGDPGDMVIVSVNGAEFTITRNLFQVLRQSRANLQWDDEYGRVSRIWADAICIDQLNDAEKSVQVMRMADIYQSAFNVVGWLGTAADLNPEIIKEVFHQADILFENHVFEFERGVDREILEENLRGGLPRLQYVLGDMLGAFIGTLLAIVQRPFFTRIWIVQEAVLAYGYPISLHIDNFSTRGLLHLWLVMTGAPLIYQKFVNYQGITAFDRIRSIRDSEDLAVSSDSEDSLSRFAKRLEQALTFAGEGGFEASKHHDYVYGLLSLVGAPRDVPQELVPDYTKPYWEVYWMYSRFLIEKTGSLLILSNPGNSIRNRQPVLKDEGIPTWVPDLRYPSHTYHTPDSKAIVSFSGHGRCMSVKGISLGSALHVIQPQQLDKPFLPVDYRASMIRKDILDQSARLRKRARDQIYRSWLSSFTAHEVYNMPVDELDGIFSDLEEDPFESSYRKMTEDEEKWKEAMFEIKTEIEASVCDQAQFVTTQGYVGSLICTSECIRKNDVICILYGMNSGAVLRPSGSDYMFVGVVHWRCFLKEKRFDNRFFAKYQVQTFDII